MLAGEGTAREERPGGGQGKSLVVGAVSRLAGCRGDDITGQVGRFIAWPAVNLPLRGGGGARVMPARLPTFTTLLRLSR